MWYLIYWKMKFINPVSINFSSLWNVDRYKLCLNGGVLETLMIHYGGAYPFEVDDYTAKIDQDMTLFNVGVNYRF